MALVNDDQVEELGLEEFLVVLGSFLTYELLIEREIHLMGGVGTLLVLLIVDFVNGICQGLEVLLYRLVHKHIAVGKVQHFLHQPSLQQTIYNLECRVGLARAGGHHQKQAALPLGYGIDGAVYGIALVITRREDVLTCAVGLVDDLQFLGGEAGTLVALRQEARIQFLLSGELVHREAALHAREEIKLLKSHAIAAEGKGNVHHHGIFLSLLNTIAYRVACILGLDDGDGRGTVVVEHIVGIFGLASRHEIAAEVNLAVGQLHLRFHGDIRHRPPFVEDGWCDIS